MSDALYLGLGALAVGCVLAGIALMSKVRTARLGNALGAAGMLGMIALTLIKMNLLSDPVAIGCLLLGLILGLALAARLKMIQMPEAVALLNGLGGLASALVAIAEIWQGQARGLNLRIAMLALLVGSVTFSGSLVAAGKLSRLLPQGPVRLPMHMALSAALLILMLGCVLWVDLPCYIALVIALVFGTLFSMRVGGADMPITISLLNSLSGVAGGLAGIATGDVLLTCVGGVVGASGLLLTQIMCRAMNRSLRDILLGTAVAQSTPIAPSQPVATAIPTAEQPGQLAPEEALRNAKDVIIVPGYGMALSQAQQHVKQLADALAAKGARVRFAIHPVAGRMPGHMSVLLCEAGVDYDQLVEMDDINSDFARCDLALIVGANDTVNPAANTAEGSPIFGMPVLRADEAPRIVVLNLDTKPGYAGVPNPLYEHPHTTLILGDAKQNLMSILARL